MLQRQKAGAQTAAEILEGLSVQPERGLSDREAEQRRQKYGLNKLQEAAKRGAWQILLAQFRSPIVALLAAAAVLSFAFQEWIEGTAIVIAILLNAVIGFVTEIRAVRSMEALKKLSETEAKVCRSGSIQAIPAEELVPGDILVFEGGDLIPADARVIEASKLQVDESALTGESVPVSKTAEPIDGIDGDVSLAEQTNVLFKGTAVTRGSGEAVVTAIGMDTELGHISEMTAQAKEEVTPLEKRLDQLGRRLIWITLSIAAVVAVSGILGGKDLLLMIETAIALSVAAVPEGLPIVATVALARGMRRMARQQALINRLSAVETLGATSIICTDKTGTLTENSMTARHILLHDGRVTVSGEGLSSKGEFRQDDAPIDLTQNKSDQDALKALLQVGVLCNNATLPQDQDEDKSAAIGDPMEVALLILGAKASIGRSALVARSPEVREVAFESDSKMMATIHKSENSGQPDYRFAVKGAPESVFSCCSQVLTTSGPEPIKDVLSRWQERSEALAKEGLRTLAFAQKYVDDPETKPYGDLTLIGLVGLLDPPRQNVHKAIEACHSAGVRVIMVTGDQAITARNVGQAVGLIQEQEQAAEGKELRPVEELDSGEQSRLQQVPIFARVSPEQKLNLIELHQKNGAIVAMTGDGVNDAPALKKADIGIAMGQHGTQVAREASDMVLENDAFSSIVDAIAQGRAIFRNIRKFTLYLLSGNVGEIMAVALASLVGAPLPLLPLQILYLNAINDVFPALALGVGEGSESLMRQPPRPSDEAVLTQRHWWAIMAYGALIAAFALGALAIALGPQGKTETEAVTISFLTLALGRLWHVFNMRDASSRSAKRNPLVNAIDNEITQNPYVWGALLLCAVILVGTVYLPGISGVLSLTHPGLDGWVLIIVGSLLPLIVGQIWEIGRDLRRRRR
ncbi:MAG: cation-translocating P-type ATPase [Elainellaceae cyanobacterium]